MDIPSPFGTDEADFDDYDEFVPAHLPEPGPFLADADVLTGDAHVSVHQRTRDLFAERSVKDATFGYNLAKLNLDARHPESGFRYAAEGDAVLRAEFTPTTAFCPQSDTLCVAAFRSWNGLADRHDYAFVRVRVDPMHQRSQQVNGKLRSLEVNHHRDVGLGPVARETAAGLQREDDDPPVSDAPPAPDTEGDDGGPVSPL
jgi:hypothetical protein